jgi:hypothetical protein
MSSLNVNSICKQINRVNLKEIPYSFLRGKVHSLLDGYVYSGVEIHQGEILFRGVVYSNKPNDVSYLGAPPIELVNNYQRCNPPKVPMFYSTSQIPSAFYEITPDVGDKVYLSKWTVASSGFDIVSLAPEYQSNAAARSQSLDLYFDTKFSEPFHESFSHRYKLTAAITEEIFESKALKKMGKNILGLAYSSVAYSGEAINFAILPNRVAEFLNLEYVEEYEVIDATEEAYKVRACDIATNFSGGEIHWEGRPKQWNIPGKSIANFTMEEGGWVMRDGNGKIVNPC